MDTLMPPADLDVLQQTLRSLRAMEPARLADMVPRASGRVLHCDCGEGQLSRRMRERGVQDIVGVERNPKTLLAARPALSEALEGDIESMDFPFEEETFDCIVLENSLPRLRDPKGTLARLMPLLSPDGILIASAPNIQFCLSSAMLANGRVEYGTEGVWARPHIKFYTGHELLRLLWDAGLGTARLLGLTVLPAEALPLDHAQCLNLGRCVIGPLNQTEHMAFLTESYVVLGTRLEEASAS